MQNHSNENVFSLQIHLHENQTHFSMKGLAQTRFETEARSNSEMTYYRIEEQEKLISTNISQKVLHLSLLIDGNKVATRPKPTRKRSTQKAVIENYFVLESS